MQARGELIRTLVVAVSESSSDNTLELPHWDTACWERLLADAELLELANGDILLQRNEATNDLFFLVKGKLEVSIPQSGTQSMSPLAVIQPGSVVGEIAFFDDHSRSASVWSRGKTVLFRLRRPAFTDFQAREPALAADLLFALGKILAGRLRRANAASASGSSYR